MQVADQYPLKDYELVLALEPTGQRPPRLFLLSRAPYISENQAKDIVSTVTQAITEILANPTSTITDLNLFSEKNKRDVLQWNCKGRKLSRDSSVVYAISRQSQRRPEKVAVSACDGELTYGQLDTITSRLAVQLRGMGVKSEEYVPIMFEKTMWAIVAEIAIMKAGGAFVPLDPSHPVERIQNIIDQSNPAVILTSEKCHARIASLGSKAVTVSHESVSRLAKVESNALPPIDPHAPAYILFTSGSTGQPKGVVQEHAALAEIYAQSEPLQITSESRVSQFASFTFTISKIETYASLTAGATLCILSDHDRLNDLTAAIDRMKISCSIMTPAALRTIDADQVPPSLRTVVVGGEVLSRNDLRAWTKSGQVELRLIYGMSEWAGGLSVTPPLQPQSDVRTIGRAMSANTWVVVPLDHNKLVPVGAVGELVLEGANLARGYLNDRIKTESLFIKDPAWLRTLRPVNDGSVRMYKTGDLVRYGPGGVLQFVSRKDTQAKIRGQRLELEEVEYHISRACPQAKRVIAEVAAPANSKDMLVLVVFLHAAQYIEEQGATSSLVGSPSELFYTDIATIRERLEEVLPDHMLPSIYLPLKSVPLTVTGKIDRRTLRQTIQQMRREELDTYQSIPVNTVQPTTDLERQLQGMFSRVLDLDAASIGIHDNFLRLGGDSVAAMRLVNLCNSEKKYPLTVADILGEKTIANLSMLITTRQPDVDVEGMTKGQAYPPGTPAFISRPFSRLGPSSTIMETFAKHILPEAGISDISQVQDAFPCSPIQSNILLSQARNPEYYQMIIAWSIHPKRGSNTINVDRLQAAWRRLCARHQMLRTVFCEPVGTDAVPTQVVLKNDHRNIDVIAGSNINAQQLVAKYRRRSPRHGMDWLPQLTLFRCNDGRDYALLDVHHALTDGMSVSIMINDLVRFYSEDIETIPDWPVNFGDYLSYLGCLDKQKALEFWGSYLAHSEPCLFPRLNNISCDLNLTAQVNTAKVPIIGSHRRYYEFCKSEGITLSNVFKLAWGLVLRYFTNSSDICFGYATAGRDAPLDGIGVTVGPFINTLICHIAMRSDMSLLQALQVTQSDFIKSVPHQRASLAEIHHALGLGTDALFNTCMTSLPYVDRDSKESSIEFREVERQDPTEVRLNHPRFDFKEPI